MTTALGSNDSAKRQATGALLAMGKSRLAALVGGHVASFGDMCWQTDAKLADVLRRPDGRKYHRESIGRVRRQLRDEGLITSRRIGPNRKIDSALAKYRTPRGTTEKRFLWPAVGLKNPFSRQQRRTLRMQQAAEMRRRGDLVRAQPRHSSVIEAFTYTPAAAPDARSRSGQAPGREHARKGKWTQEEIEDEMERRYGGLSPPDG